MGDRWIAARPSPCVVRVTGERALRFLDDTTTQDLAGLAPGRGALSCLLDGKGHVLAEFRVLPLEDGSVLLDGEAAARGALTGWLARVAPLSECEVLDESSAWSVTQHRGPASLAGVPDAEHGFVERDGAIVVRVAWGGDGFDELRRESVVAGDDPEVERLRVAAGRPRFGIDVTDDLIVNETPLLSRAVAIKGCYPGQETVAKIRNLGRVRRRVSAVRAPGAFEPGAVVHDGDAEAGRVTSAAPDGDAFAGIALVRTEIADRGAARIGDMDVVVRALE